MNNVFEYNENSINWEELNAIGIHRESLEDEDYELLLQGEETGIMSLELSILGQDIILDATLRLEEEDGETKLLVKGISPVITE